MASLFEQLERQKAIRRIAGASFGEDPEVELSPQPLPRPAFVLNEGQAEAVQQIVAWRLDPHAPCVLALTGAAGTGKSTAMQVVKERLRGTRVVWSAMTGKAASRLSEASGVDAKTFHSVLYDMPTEVDNEREQKIDLEFSALRGGGRSCLLVVDECFDYHQPILTENGWRAIGKVVKYREEIRVVSRNPNTGELELKKVTGWLKKEVSAEPLLRIDAGRSGSKRDGRVIRCTSNHKVLTPRGYVRAGDLRVGEDVIVRGPGLTEEQQSVLIGSLLGDGSLSRDGARHSVQAKCMNGIAQREYLEFKKGIFGVLASKISTYKSGYEGGKPVCSFFIRVTDDVVRIAAEMPFKGNHPSGGRMWSPTDAFLERIDEQALAIWFLDNGSTSKRPQILGKDSTAFASLHTQRFSREDNDRFAELLKRKYDVEAQVRRDTYGYWYLVFRKADTQNLFEIVRPFTPACMSWKPDGGSYVSVPARQPETARAQIRSIEFDPFNQKGRIRKHVYDIEVEGFHNYVAGNVVVSNSSMISPKIRADIDRSAYDKVLLVGDPYQIPPVLSKREEAESGADYSVFADTLGPHLSEVMRNSGAVLAAATRVREHQEIQKESASDDKSIYVYEEASDRNDALYASVQAWLDDRDDHVLITWRNETRMMANHVIRQQLGHDTVLPQPGEPLIVRRNIYNRDMYETPLMNGDVVTVEEWLNDGPTLCGVETRFLQAHVAGANSQVILVAVSSFDGVLPYVGLDAWKSAIRKEDCDEPIPMTYAYCATAHLAQGSEWRRVTTFLPGDFSNPYFKKKTILPDGSTMKFSMRFLYTALSRAKKHAGLIVSR